MQDRTLAWGLGILLLIAPLAQGLYFRQPRLLALLFLLGLTLLAGHRKIKAKDPFPRRQWPDYLAFGFLLAYGLPIPWSVYPEGALLGFLWVLACFLAYRIAISSFVNGREKILLLAIWAGTVLATLPGIAGAAGFPLYPEAFAKGRLYGTFQYANGLAIYALAAALLELGFSSHSRPSWYLAPLNVLFFLTITFTYSRGVWLVTPLGLAIFFILLPSKSRETALLKLTARVTGLLVAIPLFGRGLEAGNMATGSPAFRLTLMIGGLILGSSVAIGLDYLTRKRFRASGGKERLARVTLPLLVAALVGVAASFAWPASLSTRATSVRVTSWEEASLNPELHSARERLVQMRDALQLVTKQPLWGNGGGAWAASFRSIQSYSYPVAEIHNSYLNILVEAGIIGLGLLVALALRVALAAFRVIYRVTRGEASRGGTGHSKLPSINEGNPSVISAATASLAALGVHAIIDVDLSIGAIALLWWCLFGYLLGSEVAMNSAPSPSKPAPRNPLPRKMAGLTILSYAVSFLLTLSLWAGGQALAYGHQAWQAGKLAQAHRGYGLAVILDPLNDEAHAAYAGTWEELAQNAGDQRGLERAELELSRAVALNPYSSDHHTFLGVFLIRQGVVEEGLSHVEEALRLAPYQVQRYENLAVAYLSSGSQALAEGRKDEGKVYLEKVLLTAERLRMQKPRTSIPLPPKETLPPATPELDRVVTKALELLMQ